MFRCDSIAPQESDNTFLSTDAPSSNYLFPLYFHFFPLPINPGSMSDIPIFSVKKRQ